MFLPKVDNHINLILDSPFDRLPYLVFHLWDINIDRSNPIFMPLFMLVCLIKLYLFFTDGTVYGCSLHKLPYPRFFLINMHWITSILILNFTSISISISISIFVSIFIFAMLYVYLSKFYLSLYSYNYFLPY